MAASNASEEVTRVVSQLGGPAIAPEDIDLALDFPAGRQLLEFLAEQVQGSKIVHDEAANREGDRARLFNAALHGISLESDEVQELNRIKGQPSVTSKRETDSMSIPPGYIVPSQLRTKADYMDKESSLIEGETKILKHRLAQFKSAQKTMAQSIKSIQAAIKALDTEIEERVDHLAELSVSADSAIDEGTSAAFQTMDSCAVNLNPRPNESPRLQNNRKIDLGHYISALDSLTETRATIIRSSEARMEQVDQVASELPSSNSVKIDAARLERAFHIQKGDMDGKKPVQVTLLQKARAASYRAELARMCQHFDSGGAIDDIIGNASIDHKRAQEVDMKSEIERAWIQDQAAILVARNGVLDNTLKAFNEQIIPPLTQLHDKLSKTDLTLKDLQAKVGALGEEFEELVDDVRNSKRLRKLKSSTTTTDEGEDEEDVTLETNLINLLKEFKNFRAVDSAPLVLLDRSDVLSELRSLKSRIEAIDRREQEWTEEVPKVLESLSSSHETILSQILKHSPLNTSPPFAPSEEVSSLKREAQDKASDLQLAADKLQDGLKIFESSRTTRKLSAFTEKWCKQT